KRPAEVHARVGTPKYRIAFEAWVVEVLACEARDGSLGWAGAQLRCRDYVELANGSTRSGGEVHRGSRREHPPDAGEDRGALSRVAVTAEPSLVRIHANHGDRRNGARQWQHPIVLQQDDGFVCRFECRDPVQRALVANQCRWNVWPLEQAQFELDAKNAAHCRVDGCDWNE